MWDYMLFMASASFTAAIIYGAIFVVFQPSLTRAFIKTCAVGFLSYAALIAFEEYVTPEPYLVVYALIASAIGDWFMSWQKRIWILFGITAFFVAHAAYLIYFWQLHGDSLGAISLASSLGVITLSLFTAITFVWLAFIWGRISPMQIPVTLYSFMIAACGALVMLLPDIYIYTKIGMLLFIVSDMLLSLTTFSRAEDYARNNHLEDWKPQHHPFQDRLVWFLYYTGQALIVFGLLFGHSANMDTTISELNLTSADLRYLQQIDY